jgi:hypothetical protein
MCSNRATMWPMLEDGNDTRPSQTRILSAVTLEELVAPRKRIRPSQPVKPRRPVKPTKPQKPLPTFAPFERFETFKTFRPFRTFRTFDSQGHALFDCQNNHFPVGIAPTKGRQSGTLASSLC